MQVVPAHKQYCFLEYGMKLRPSNKSTQLE